MQPAQKNSPLVSVGIPVYNGENYLEEAIESVLNQTYSNWEMVISDNASTDATQSICESFRQQDSRIKYSRYEINYGASKNYNNTFKLARGKYFKWLPHDDKISPDNIAKSVEIMENNDDVSLCGSSKIHIDSKGCIIDIYDFKPLHLSNNDTLERYKAFLEYFSASFANADFVMGLIRSNILKQTNLIGNYTAADFTLLGELILRGKFYVIEEPLYIRRIHHGFSTSVYNNDPGMAKKIDSSEKIRYKSHAEIAKWYDPNGKVRYIPHFTWLNELLRSIKNAGFSFQRRFQLSLSSYKWFFKKFTLSLRGRISKLKVSQ